MEWIVENHYQTSWDSFCEAEQNAALNAERGEATLLYGEPEPTYTAGRNALESERVWSEEDCRKHHIAIRRADRGGRWTYHGPGQMVLYPIASLDSLGLHSKATRPYMDRFRGAVCRWLTSLGVPTRLPEDRPFGIYSGDKKLAAFGVSLEGGVTRGGMALYLTDQNAPFQGLVPCGIPGEKMTSLQELGFPLSCSEAAIGVIPFLKEGLKPTH